MAPEPRTSRFDRDTALVAVGDRCFEGRMDRGWWIERGPNGGYVAAVILRALTMAVDVIPMRERYETRWAIGPLPFTAGDRAEAGGWIRLTDPRPVDHVQLAAMSDAWLPPAFSRSAERFGLPTIDLTIHFRSATLPDDDWFLARFRTRSSIEGFLEEDGEIWSRDARLLVQSRQLSLVMAVPG